MRLERSTYYYRAAPADDGPLLEALKLLAAMRPRWGLRRLLVLLRREGWRDNHKRVERIYRAARLQVPHRRRKKTARWRGEPQRAPESINECWSLDFIHDNLWNGRKIRFLTIQDDFSREGLAIEADTSLPGKRVVRVLDSILEHRPPPIRLLMDNGPEFIGRDLDEWAYRHGVKLGFIEAGKPTQNGFHESFHGKFRDECLNEHWFLSVADARRIAGEYRYDYNHVRPHSSLEYLTPAEFAAKEAARLSPLSPQGAEQGQAEGVDNHKVPVLSMPVGLSS